jgi:dienelactone hydrolase
MGDRIELEAGPAYLAGPDGAGPAVVVLPDGSASVEDVCDRLADEGFTALAPESAGGAAGAVDHLSSSDRVRGDGVGVVAFGDAGGPALALAEARPDEVKACVLFDPATPPDVDRVGVPVQCHTVDDEDEEAARTAWVRTLEFLRAKLG